MLKITPAKLWTYLSHAEDAETYDDFLAETLDAGTLDVPTQAEWDQLVALPGDDEAIKRILVDQNISENHPGGDEMVTLVNDVLSAQEEGFEVVSWYGADAQVLIVGVAPDKIQMVYG